MLFISEHVYLYHFLGKFCRQHIDGIFLIRKQDWTFHANLHEMSKPVFLEKQKKYFNLSSAENYIQSAKC